MLGCRYTGGDLRRAVIEDLLDIASLVQDADNLNRSCIGKVNDEVRTHRKEPAPTKVPSELRAGVPNSGHS